MYRYKYKDIVLVKLYETINYQKWIQFQRNNINCISLQENAN